MMIELSDKKRYEIAENKIKVYMVIHYLLK